MAEVSVTINGRKYSMECDNGQEARVRELGQYVDQRVTALAQGGAGNSDMHLLVLASLMIADEATSNGSSVPTQPSMSNPKDEQVVVQAIDHLAGRIEAIADRIQSVN